MREQLSIFSGVLRYEFLMQIRRRALWITFLSIALLFLIRGSLIGYLSINPFHLSETALLADWTRGLMFLFPIAIGVLLADRLPRDRRTRVEEILTSLPGTLQVHIAGKYLGSMLATLIPFLMFYWIGVGIILYSSHDAQAIPIALLTFITIALPGIIFVSAFSIACPAIMWVPLYQFLFIGYWFWGNILAPSNGIPTLSATILTPVGGYMASGFFGDNEQLIQHATTLQGIESILLLLGISVLVFFVLVRLLKWQSEM